MKKYIYILAAVTSLVACGQSKEDAETEAFEKEQQRKMDSIQGMRERNKKVMDEAYKNGTDPDSIKLEVYKEE